MLKTLRAYVGYHFQANQSSFYFFKKKPLSTVMTIMVIAITLALPALFWIFIDNINQLTSPWVQARQITLYLKQPLTQEQQKLVFERISSMHEVGEATLKTPTEGMSILQAQEGMQDIMNSLNENPLPAVIEVYPALHINTPEQLQQLRYELLQDGQVEQAKLDMQWIHRLKTILHFASTVVFGVMLLLALAVILIIGNTLRLAIYNRQDEIRILKLVGASDPFIMRPFLYSGVWYGLAGAMVALLLIRVFIAFISRAANQVAATYQMDYPLSTLSWRQVFIMLILAAILGWLAARLSVKRHLTYIEPYS